MRGIVWMRLALAIEFLVRQRAPVPRRHGQRQPLAKDAEERVHGGPSRLGEILEPDRDLEAGVTTSNRESPGRRAGRRRRPAAQTQPARIKSGKALTPSDTGTGLNQRNHAGDSGAER